jgi:transcription elongation factor Elf1
MAEELQENDKAKKQKPLQITFKCQRCNKRKPLEDMRSITRFIPVLVVCRDCEKEMR